MKRILIMLFALTLLNLNYSCTDESEISMLESNATISDEVVNKVKK